MGNKQSRLEGMNKTGRIIIGKSPKKARNVSKLSAITSQISAMNASSVSLPTPVDHISQCLDIPRNGSNSSLSQSTFQSGLPSDYTPHNGSTAVTEDFANLSFSCCEKSLPDPTICFVSLFYLHKSWKSIPHGILRTSIILLYCRREWVFKHGKAKKPITNAIVNMIEERELSKDSSFLDFLRLKEKQGRLLFIDPCMEPYDGESDENGKLHIDERWHMVSRFLSQFQCPVTVESYDSLVFNQDWWQKKFDRSLDLSRTPNQELTFADIVSPLQYCQHLKYITEELSNMKWNFNSVLEIISQSIPTLLPMIAYDSDRFQTKKNIYESVLFTDDINCINSKTIEESKAMRALFLIEDNEGMVFLK